MIQVTRGERGLGCLKLLSDFENGDKLFGVGLKDGSDMLNEKIDASDEAPDKVWDAAFKFI